MSSWSLSQTIKLTFINVDRNIAILVYQINDFLLIEYQHDDSVLDSIKNLAASIVASTFRSLFAKSTSRNRSRNQSIEATRSWSTEWATNRVVFRQVVRSFEQKISHLLVDNLSFDSSFVNGNFTSSSSISSDITKEISRSKMSSNNDTQTSLVAFSDAQRRELTAMIAKAFRNQDQSSTSSNDTSFATTANSQSDRDPQDWKFDEIDFFDFEYENSNNSLIINVDRHVFYRDVYAFTNRLRNLASLRENDKLRIVISQCLRDSALIWHFMKLFDVEKMLLRKASLNFWCIALITRFKERTLIVLQRLQRKRYIMIHARKQKNSRLFAQDIFRHAKTVEMDFVYNQLSLAWNNLDWKFRRDVFESTSNIIIRKFLDQLDFKIEIWYEMTRRSDNQDDNQTSTQRSNSNNKSSKRQDRANDYTQSSFDNIASQF